MDFNTLRHSDTPLSNGVFMDAKFSTIDGEKSQKMEVPDDLNMKDGVVLKPSKLIISMDGRTLLNYARFRKDDEG